MEIKRIFELKEEHLMLLRKMYTMWNDSEFGAPMIDPKRPYGNSDVFRDIANILGYGERYSINQEVLMDKLHKETEIALQIVLTTGKFESGIYVADNYKSNWSKIDEIKESKESDESDESKRKTQDGITLIS